MSSARIRLAVALTSVVLVAGGIPGTMASAAASPVEDYASYDGQSTCSSTVLPGTAYLLRYLVRTNPGTRASSTLRACTGDAVSEHKDGRALDWGVDATVPAERDLAYAWLRRIFATDARGNAHARARRMGIMYIIWDDHIYKAYDGFRKQDYSPCANLDSCSKTLRHRDHVHVSLSRAGAAAQTSFYRARNVRSIPVLYPGTKRLDPVSTAEVTFRVPATGGTVTTGFKLTSGVRYRVVADGLVRTGAGSRIADAACRWTSDGWAPRGVLRVGGTNPWPASCSPRHTYQGTYTPSTTGFLDVRVDENTPADAEGALTFSILRADIPARSIAAQRVPGAPEPQPAQRAGRRAAQVVSEQVAVPASASRGALTRHSLRRSQSYRVVVTGVSASGSTRLDGQCVKYARRWRLQHTLDLTSPTSDHLSLYIQGVRVPLRATGSSHACDGASHKYVGVFEPVVNGRSRVKVWDPYTYSDNTGTLAVVLRRR